MPRNDLILRIGADDGPLRAALKRLNNDLVRAGEKLESVGQSLTLRLSVPIAAAGGAAIKAFADFEKLEKSLAAVSGSAGEAEATLSRLRKLALQPGIDLQNAVTASIRLQTVGFEAQRAEDLILQFSKAVTLAGGSGEDLGEVVRQISQIISRGKVLREDFSVIQERVPAIGIALQNAFGTTNIEAIRDAGIGARDFIDRLTEGIRVSKEFQDVQGGIGNALNNFQQAVQASLVTVGRAISESINLEKVLDDVSTVISRLAEGFSNLDPDTKRVIVSIAGVVAAIGPLLVGIGALLKVLPLLRLGFATLLGPVGLIATAVGLLVGEFIAYKLEASAAEKAQKAVNNALSDAAQRTEEEKNRVNDLIGVIRSETATKGEKAEAIERLKRISPEYFGGLDIEKTKTEDLIQVSNEYNRSLATRNELQEINAKSQAAQEELVKVQKQLAAASALAQKQAGGQFGVYAGGANDASAQVRKLEKQTEELQSRITAFADEAQRITIDFASAPTQEVASSAPKPLDLSVAPTNDPGLLAGVESLTKSISDQASAAAQSFDPFEERLRVINQLAENSFAKRLADDFEQMGQVILTAQNPLAQLGQTFQGLQDQSVVFGESFDLITEKINATRAAIQQALDEGFSPTSTVVQGLTEIMAGLNAQLEAQQAIINATREVNEAYTTAFNSSVNSQVKGFADVGKAALSAAAKVVKAKIQEATVNFIADSFAKFGIFGAVAAAGAGAIVGGVVSKALTALNIPALAEGGLVTGPTLALIGEGRENEVVLPLSKLNNLINNSAPRERLVATVGIGELYVELKRYEQENGRVN